jgi:hypothetical protein
VNLQWTRSPLALIIAAGAAYRLTRLWTAEDFPPVVAIRTLLQEHLQEGAIAADKGEHPLDALTWCPWCAGFWITAAVVAATSSPALAPLWKPLATTLALSAAVGKLSAHDE